MGEEDEEDENQMGGRMKKVVKNFNDYETIKVDSCRC